MSQGSKNIRFKMNHTYARILAGAYRNRVKLYDRQNVAWQKKNLAEKDREDVIKIVLDKEEDAVSKGVLQSRWFYDKLVDGNNLGDTEVAYKIIDQKWQLFIGYITKMKQNVDRSLAFNQTEGNFFCSNIGSWFTWREDYNEWLHKAVPYNNFGRGPSVGEKLAIVNVCPPSTGTPSTSSSCPNRIEDNLSLPGASLDRERGDSVLVKRKKTKVDEVRRDSLHGQDDQSGSPKRRHMKTAAAASKASIFDTEIADTCDSEGPGCTPSRRGNFVTDKRSTFADDFGETVATALKVLNEKKGRKKTVDIFSSIQGQLMDEIRRKKESTDGYKIVFPSHLDD